MKKTLNIITILLILVVMLLMVIKVADKNNQEKKCINKYDTKNEIIENCFNN